MDIGNHTLESLKHFVITTRDAALMKHTNCDATNALKKLTADARCPFFDEYSSTNPACKDRELTSVVLIFD